MNGDTTHTRGRSQAWLLAVLVTGQFMANVDTAIANVAAPSIRSDLGASGGELQLVVSGYVIAYAMLLITGARLGDLGGYRRVFLLGVAGFTTASLACGLAPGPVPLLVARIAQGIGAALMVPQVLSGIQLHFPGAARTRALGVLVMVMSASAVAGQVLAGVLISADLFGSAWRPVFLINVPVGVALLLAAARCLPADPGSRGKRLDLAGVATLSLAVLLAVVPLTLGRDGGWPAWTWVSLGLSVPAMGLFVLVERRVAFADGYPLANLQVLRRPAVGWGLLAYAVATGTYFAMLFVLAIYLQQGLGRSALVSGLALVSWVAAFGVAGAVLRRLPPARAPRLAVPGYVLLAAAYAAVAVGLAGGLSDGVLLMGLLGAGGLGLGTGFSALVSHMTSSVPPAFAPDLSGMITTGAQLAGATGVATFGSVYLSLAPHPGAQPAAHAFTVVAAGFAAAALLAAFAAHRSTRDAVAVAGERAATS